MLPLGWWMLHISDLSFKVDTDMTTSNFFARRSQLYDLHEAEAKLNLPIKHVDSSGGVRFRCEKRSSISSWFAIIVLSNTIISAKIVSIGPIANLRTHSARMMSPAGLSRSFKSCHCIFKGIYKSASIPPYPTCRNR